MKGPFAKAASNYHDKALGRLREEILEQELANLLPPPKQPEPEYIPLTHADLMAGFHPDGVLPPGVE